ncbi:MAG: flagellar basal body P-ring formation chaperone FlgA [Telluria sp.]
MKALPLLLLALAVPAVAQQATARQDLAQVQAVAADFLKAQTAGLPGKVTLTVTPVAPNTVLAACAAPEAFLLPGARPWGKTTVGVRCTAPAPWKIYLQAQVSVVASYLAAAMPLAQGQPVTAAQLVKQEGDLAALPAGVATEPAQVVGKMPLVTLPAGAPLRLDSLKSKPVVQQGQLVRVVSSGAGFNVSAEGRAIGTAAEGQVVQVRTPNGAVVSGVAQASGMVEVTF